MLTYIQFLTEALTLADVKRHLSQRQAGAGALQLAASGGAYFLLPDGSAWHTSGEHHTYAFMTRDVNSITKQDELAFWATCQREHLVLVHTVRAYECQASISSAQAERIVSEYQMTNPPGAEPLMLYVDICQNERSMDNKMFTDRVTASALRAWVNSHF